jgi:hypothetical protein
MFEKARVAVLAILTCCIFVSVRPAVSQIDDVQAAIARKDDLGALRILSAISDLASTPDTYLYRGIAYANLRQCKRALEAFREGFKMSQRCVDKNCSQLRTISEHLRFGKEFGFAGHGDLWRT